MGGCGSGTWYRWNRKSTLEEHKRLDIRDLCRRKLLYPGCSFAWGWNIDGKPSGDIRVEIKQDHLFLIYRYRDGGEEWRDVQERVSLTWTRCHYGGRRPWFVCPRCGRRVGILAAGVLHGHLPPPFLRGSDFKDFDPSFFAKIISRAALI